MEVRKESKEKEHKFSHTIHIGRICSFLTYAVIMEVQMGEMSKLG
jgi:hypothetical protein